MDTRFDHDLVYALMNVLQTTEDRFQENISNADSRNNSKGSN